MESGERIGPYRVVRRLGEGGVGEVFQAVDETLARDVAIKRLRPELAAREQLVARFHAEAQTLARLNHPNIATLYALEQAHGTTCMVMEHVEGDTIASLLRQRGPLGLQDGLRLALQALDGIGYAHARGVIHRDIKGSNLMIDATGTLKIMDFGIARVLGEERQTRAGQLVGTPEFMAPEQIRGEDADERSDLYSLAILIYSLFSGHSPFRANSDYDVMKAQVESAAPSILGDCPGLPPALDAVLSRAMAKHPNDRFQNVAQMREAIEALCDFPTPTGEFVWPQGTPREQAETSLLASTGADPDAPTLTPTSLAFAAALPLIDAEPITELTEVRAAPPTRRLHRGWWAAAASVAGLVLGIDLLELRAAPVAPPPQLQLGPIYQPATSPLADRVDGPDPAVLAPVSAETETGTTSETTAKTAGKPEETPTEAQARPQISRSSPPTLAVPTRKPARERPQGDKTWVIRRH